MSVHDNFRTATDETTTVPTTRRTTGQSGAPRWLGPAAMAAVAVTALVGVNAFRSTDDPAPTPRVTAPEVNSKFEPPLIGVEERAIINGEYPPLPWHPVRTSRDTEPVTTIDLCATRTPC